MGVLGWRTRAAESKLEVFALDVQLSKEGPNVTAVRAAGLGECAGLHGRECSQRDSGGIGELLGEHVAGDLLVTVPFHNGLRLVVHDLVSISGSRSGCGTIEVAPLVAGLHSFLKSHLEGGPVGTIGVETGDTGSTVEWGGHVISSGKGRAHNLLRYGRDVRIDRMRLVCMRAVRNCTEQQANSVSARGKAELISLFTCTEQQAN